MKKPTKEQLKSRLKREAKNSAKKILKKGKKAVTKKAGKPKKTRKVSGKPKPKKVNKLTNRQKLFRQEYLVDLNGTQAAIRAGYSKKTAQEQASRLLSNVIIKAEIQKEMDKRIEKVEVTADYVLGNLKEIGERCMQRVPVMVRDGKDWRQKTEVNDEGEMVGVWEFQSMSAIKANELLGKHIKLFTEKVEEKIIERKVFVTEKEQSDADNHINESLK